MRYLLSILLLALLVSCASSSHIPFPKATKYDDDPKFRELYRHSFEEGYTLGLRDLTTSSEWLSASPPPRDVAATLAGFRDGQIAGFDEYHKRKKANNAKQ